MPREPSVCEPAKASRVTPSACKAPTVRTERSEKALHRFYDHVDRSITDRPEVQWHLTRLRSLAHGKPQLVVLDIGCGDGSLSARSVVPVAGARVLGVDVAIQALRRARQRGLIVARAELDGNHIPFRTGTMDAVVLSQVVEHVVDTDGLMDEIRRVLKPGGTLLLSTPNLAAWFNRILLLVGVQPVFSEVSLRAVFGRPGELVVGHLRLFTARAMRPFLAAHGFVDIELSGATYHDVPKGARWLDRVFARRPGLAAQILVSARTPVRALATLVEPSS